MQGPFLDLGPGRDRQPPAGAAGRGVRPPAGDAPVPAGADLLPPQPDLARSTGRTACWPRTSTATPAPTRCWNNLLLGAGFRVPDPLWPDLVRHLARPERRPRRPERDRRAARRPTATAARGSTPCCRTVRFRTEAVPSQDPERYVGLTYPAARDGSASPYYPDHFRPFFTLKSGGLLPQDLRPPLRRRRAPLRDRRHPRHAARARDRRHRQLRLVAARRERSRTCVSQCLPAAQHLSWGRLDVWQAQLAPARDYSMQLTDLRPGATPPLWSRSFRTSAFRTFAAHVAHAVDLLSRAEVLPVVDAAAAGADPREPDRRGAERRRARPRCAGRGDLPRPPRHRRRQPAPALRRAGRRLRRPLIGRDETGEKLWGVVLELDEPLIGRQGVSVTSIRPMPSAGGAGALRRRRGGERLLLVSDSAGTRVIILGSATRWLRAVRRRGGDGAPLCAGRRAGLAGAAHLEATARPLSRRVPGEARRADGGHRRPPGARSQPRHHEATLAVSLPLPPTDAAGSGLGWWRLRRSAASGAAVPRRPAPDPARRPGPAGAAAAADVRPVGGRRSQAGRNALMLTTGRRAPTAFAAAGAARKAAKKRRRKRHKKRQGQKE